MDDPKIYAKQCHMLIDKIELHKNKSEYNSITYNANQDFWNTGMPIETRYKLETEKQKSQEDIEEENRIKVERAKQREAAILANLK